MFGVLQSNGEGGQPHLLHLSFVQDPPGPSLSQEPLPRPALSLGMRCLRSSHSHSIPIHPRAAGCKRHGARFECGKQVRVSRKLSDIQDVPYWRKLPRKDVRIPRESLLEMDQSSRKVSLEAQNKLNTQATLGL